MVSHTKLLVVEEEEGEEEDLRSKACLGNNGGFPS